MPTPPRNFESRTLYHGDNLPFLRGMNSGTVDLIATDPPFNKSRDFHSAPNRLASGASFVDRWSWERDVHEEWWDNIKDNWPKVYEVIDASRHAFGDDMGAFLCWLGVRLMEMHRVLADHGSIYLHIDHTAHAYVKTLMDAIFGKQNFRNEIVWWYKNASRGKKQFARAHDTLLWYSKNPKSYLFNRDDVLVPFESGMTEWRYSQGGQADKEMPKGKTPDDVILLPSLNTMDKERTGYPTQKPLALYERIVKASSKKGDMVLDPFCGCATTPVAAERLSREWVGIDLWRGAHKIVLDRLTKETRKSMAWNNSVTYSTKPPVRTDDNEIAAPNLRLRIRRPIEPWARLTNRAVRSILEKAQAVGDLIGCAGCGRALEGEFMELDHIHPKAEGGEDHMVNRILLCRPCNGRKSNQLTMAGLRRENAREGWMRDRSASEQTQQRALHRTTFIRDNWGQQGFDWDAP